MCAVVIDPCSSSPCANNSSCIPMGSFDYTCPQCAAGYTGPRCEVNIDDCQSALCPNNSTSNFTTEAASENKTMPTTTMKLIILYYSVAAAGTVALIVIAIIIFTVVLAVIMIKWKRKRIHCSHQGKGNWDATYSALDVIQHQEALYSKCCCRYSIYTLSRSAVILILLFI